MQGRGMVLLGSDEVLDDVDVHHKILGDDLEWAVPLQQELLRTRTLQEDE